ncbi:MAG: hypothetical protein ACM3JD_06965 [Rudaea sp.]
MPVNRFLGPVLALVVLLGTVLGAQLTGLWSTSGKTTVTAGELKAADIKGWMTLQQVIDGLPISQAELYAIGKIPADVPSETALKDLEPLATDFSVTALRDALTAREAVALSSAPLVSPVSAVSSAPPETAAAVVEIRPTATAAPVEVKPLLHGDVTPTPFASGEVLAADQIKGKMTLREVSVQCGVPLDGLLTALGLPGETNPETLLKDLVQQGKIAEVTAVQNAVAGLQK